MRSTRRPLAAIAICCAIALAGMWRVHSEDKRLAIFAPQANYSVAITEAEGHSSVSLLELLDPLAHPDIRINKDRVKIHLESLDAELRDGSSKVKIGRGEFDLGGKISVTDGGVLVPLHSIPVVLSRLLGVTSDLHEGARRLLIGGAGVKFTAELRKGEPPALVLNFSAPVNPSVSTEPGRLRLVFTRDPVTSGSENYKFDDATIPGATYHEGGGTAELEISGKAPLMASFSEGGKTITIAAAPTQQAAAGAPQTSAPQAPATEAPATPPPTGPSAPLVAGAPRTRYLVVIDPGHGGEDPGAKLTPTLQEKDITLVFARRLRAALEDRGVPARLLRDGDSTISNEQRAAAANNLHATIFVAVHASEPGSGVRLYTSMLPEGDLKNATFFPWEGAQSYFVRPSRIVAQAAVEELGKRKIAVLLMPANVRPMNNVAAAAIGVELAVPPEEPDSVTSAKYQDPIAAAVAAGIANARAPLEAPQ
jgi:N-acetylmuramoyl-L-alanine amidase